MGKKTKVPALAIALATLSFSDLANAQTAIKAGEILSGELTTSDLHTTTQFPQIGDAPAGEFTIYHDCYVYQSEGRERLRMEAISTQMDVDILVGRSSGCRGQSGIDYDSGEGTDAQLDFVSALYGPVYIKVFAKIDGKELLGGKYRLRLSKLPLPAELWKPGGRPMKDEMLSRNRRPSTWSSPDGHTNETYYKAIQCAAGFERIHSPGLKIKTFAEAKAHVERNSIYRGDFAGASFGGYKPEDTRHQVAEEMLNYASASDKEIENHLKYIGCF